MCCMHLKTIGYTSSLFISPVMREWSNWKVLHQYVTLYRNSCILAVKQTFPLKGMVHLSRRHPLLPLPRLGEGQFHRQEGDLPKWFIYSSTPLLDSTQSRTSQKRSKVKLKEWLTILWESKKIRLYIKQKNHISIVDAKLKGRYVCWAPSTNRKELQTNFLFILEMYNTVSLMKVPLLEYLAHGTYQVKRLPIHHNFVSEFGKVWTWHMW